nr:truncated ORF1 [Porcine circovirus]
MPSKKNGRSGPQPHKRWVFTLNNPSEDERKKIREYRDFVGPPSRGNKVVNIKSQHVHRPGGRCDCGSLDSISEGAGEAAVENAIFPSPAVAVAGVDEPGAAAEDLAKMAAGAVSSSPVTPPWIRHS